MIALALWSALGLMGAGLAALLARQSHWFGYDWRVAEMPVLPFVAGTMLAGVVFLVAALLVRRTLEAGLDGGVDGGAPVALMLLFGAVFRLLLWSSEPVLEDDYQRYLWDGALAAHGLDVYAITPRAARKPDAPALIARLADRSGPVLRRVNHPQLTTVYPPVAQAFFALAHVLAPFSLKGWRAVVLVGDALTLGLIVLLLVETGRSPLWATLYWWNPIVIKELANSVHMEAVLMPLVLLALWLALKGRRVGAAAALALAVGVKVWPALLFPLLMRGAGEARAGARRMLASSPLCPRLRSRLRSHLRPHRRLRAIMAPSMLFAGLCLVWLWLVARSGLGPNSGFLAYAARWRTNSALFPFLERSLAAAQEALGLGGLAPGLAPGLLVRAGILVVLAVLALAIARRPLGDAGDLVRRAGLMVAAIFLLSPAQFPWYAIWVIAFLPFLPRAGLAALALTMPLYYSAFHLMSEGRLELYKNGVVWVIWLPIWALLIAEWWRGRPFLAIRDLPQQRVISPNQTTISPHETVISDEGGEQGPIQRSDKQSISN